jgi:RNA polymerase sigma-70 factor (ECF subfamily)
MSQREFNQTDDSQVIAALRSSDESAFRQLVEQYYATMLRLATIYVLDSRVAEEVIQETWIAVLRGLDRFEGRSSLKTWIFSILVNRAKTLTKREDRYVQFSEYDSSEADEPSVAPERFSSSSDHSGHWVSLPRRWDDVPEEHLLSQETRDTIRRAMEALPPNQREVMTLRDIEGWSSEEVCNVLMISETNQRVLLHRARSRVRQALEVYFNNQV